MPQNTTAEFVIRQHAAQQVALLFRWLAPVSVHLGRTPEEVQSAGLCSSDFNSDLVACFEDGSRMSFRRAFYVRHQAIHGLVAVFSEHCGYFELFLGPEGHISLAPPRGGLRST